MNDNDPLGLNKEDPLGLNDPLGLKGPSEKVKTSPQEDFRRGLADAATTGTAFVSAVAGAGLRGVGKVLPKEYEEKAKKAAAQIERGHQKFLPEAEEWKNINTGGVPTKDKVPGVGGNVISGITNLAVTYPIGWANLVVQGIGGAKKEYDRLIKEGVDEKTAHDMAGFEAFSQMITAAIPQAGGNVRGGIEIAKAAAASAGINVGQYWVTSWLKQRGFENAGYEKLANEVKPTLEGAVSSAAVGAAGAAVPAMGHSGYEKLQDWRQNRHSDRIQRAADEKAALLPKATVAPVKKGENYDLLQGDNGVPNSAGTAAARAAAYAARKEAVLLKRQERKDQREGVRYLEDNQGTLFQGAGQNLAPRPLEGADNTPLPIPEENQLALPLVPPMEPRIQGDFFQPDGTPPEGVIGGNKGYSVVKGKDDEGNTAWYVADENEKVVSRHPEKQQAEKVVEASTESSRPPNIQAALRRKQGGFINFFGKKKPEPIEVDADTMRKAGKLKKIPGFNIQDSFLIAKDIDSGIEQALSLPDIAPSITGRQLDAGIHATAASTGNPLLGYIQGKLRDANHYARKKVDEVVDPAGRSWSVLKTDSDMADVRAIINRQMKERTDYTVDQLRAAGYSENVINAVGMIRKALDTGFTDWNTKRDTADQLQNYMQGYFPSRFRGDYMSFVMRDGKVVDVLSTKSLAEMNKAQKWAQRTYGDGVQITKADRRAQGDFGQGDFVSALNQLMRVVDNDPALAGLKETLKEKGYDDAKKMFQFDNHELTKKGIASYDGNKGWKSAKENNKDFYDSFVDYMDELYITSGRYEVMQDLGKARGNADLAALRPNLHKYLDQQYNHIRGSTGDIGRHINGMLDGLWKAGTNMLGQEQGFSTLRSGNNALINKFQDLKLGMFHLKQAFVNTMQLPVLAWPAISQLDRAFGGSLPSGTAALNMTHTGTLTAALAIAHKIGGPDNPVYNSLSPDMKIAYDYARDNGLFKFSEMEHVRQYGEGQTKSMAKKILDAPNTLSEGFIRPTTFMAAFKTARDRGIGVDQSIQIAASITGRTMNEFDASFRPMLYQSLGEVGKQAGQFKTFVHGYIHQMNTFRKQDPIALAQMLAAQFAVAGFTGMPFYNQIAAAYEYFFDRDMTDDARNSITHLAGPLANKKEIDSIMYGAASAFTGLNLHTSASSADLLPNDFLKSVMPSSMTLATDVIPKVKDFIMMPDSANLRNMVRSVTPASTQGTLDMHFQTRKRDSDGKTILLDKDNNALDVELTPRDIAIRKFSRGFTSLNQFSQQNQSFHNAKVEATRNAKLKNQKDQFAKYLSHGEYTNEGLAKRFTNMLELIKDDPIQQRQLVVWYAKQAVKTGLRSQMPAGLVQAIQNNDEESILRYLRLTHDVRDSTESNAGN